MNTPEPLDFVSFVLAIIAFLVSKEVAQVVGAYAAIIVLACAGAALSLSGTNERMNYGNALVYIIVRIMVAIVLTVMWTRRTIAVSSITWSIALPSGRLPVTR